MLDKVSFAYTTQTMSHVIYKSCQMCCTWEWWHRKCDFEQEYDYFYGTFEFEAEDEKKGWMTHFKVGLANINVIDMSCCKRPASSWYLPIDYTETLFRFPPLWTFSPSAIPPLPATTTNRKESENLFNFNSKWTLKSWYCSAYYVNLMRYNKAR